jgi:hypothetical protein
MLTTTELTSIARARLKDGNVLLSNSRYDGAIYICGYALEIALKARIVKTLMWPGFPESKKDFKDLQSFKTHDLDMLLKLSGWEPKIKTEFPVEWSIVAQWDPESRYKVPGSASQTDVDSMIENVTKLVEIIL